MHAALGLLSIAFILLTLFDGFETIVQPRRITHRFRFARIYYRTAWPIWRLTALHLFNPGRRRQAFLSIFGPLSLLGLFATWVILLIVSFGLLQWSFHVHIQSPDAPAPTLKSYIELSGATFFTFSFSDLAPNSSHGRAIAIAEAGVGFGFLAIIISYLPVLYQAYSNREVTISLLDARAGSPPSASQILLRLARTNNLHLLETYLGEWETWCAQLLESHLSFPVLIYYRSQHDNQSWLAALTTILDTCALLISQVQSKSAHRAQLTFAMARHAAVDLNLILRSPRRPDHENRLAADQLQQLRSALRQANVVLYETPQAETRLTELRSLYEPFLSALSSRFLFSLPPLIAPDRQLDNWQRSSWQRPSPGIGQLDSADEHF